MGSMRLNQVGLEDPEKGALPGCCCRGRVVGVGRRCSPSSGQHCRARAIGRGLGSGLGHRTQGWGDYKEFGSLTGGGRPGLRCRQGHSRCRGRNHIVLLGRQPGVPAHTMRDQSQAQGEGSAYDAKYVHGSCRCLSSQCPLAVQIRTAFVLWGRDAVTP